MIAAQLTPSQRVYIERSRAFRQSIAARAVPQSPPRERPCGIKGYQVIPPKTKAQDLKPQSYPAEPDPPPVSRHVVAMQMEAVIWPVIPAEVEQSDKRYFVHDIIREVAKYFEVRVADILSENRRKRIVRPRHIAVYLAYLLTGRSSLFIGRQFKRDHATILHAIEKVQRELREDEQLAFDVAHLIRIITGTDQ